MKRQLTLLSSSLVLGAVLLACTIGAVEQSTAAPVQTQPPLGTTIAATSAVPTATAASATTGNALPSGTLILNQVGNAIARLPGTSGRSLSLGSDRVGNQGSPNGQYGVRAEQAERRFNLFLVDYSTADTKGKEIPQGTNLAGPGITWKRDSSGFAIHDFPPDANAQVNAAILYYDVKSGQTSSLVAAPTDTASVAAGLAFSADGKLFAYAVGKKGSEGIGGPDSSLFSLDLGSKASTPLPKGLLGFEGWLGDSAKSDSFLMRRFERGVSQIAVYSMAQLQQPVIITPANTSDFLVATSPDGRRLVLSSSPTTGAEKVAQIVMVNPDGSSRRTLTQFTAGEQSITGLVWAVDGIYYSLTSADNKATTWRMNLDGTAATQVAEGTLIGIVGAR